jgi:hypothetical protein
VLERDFSVIEFYKKNGFKEDGKKKGISNNVTEIGIKKIDNRKEGELNE